MGDKKGTIKRRAGEGTSGVEEEVEKKESSRRRG